MTHPLVFKNSQISLVVGDKLMLTEPTHNHSFYCSKFGQLFKAAKCDKAYLEVKQYSWLEVYFLLTLELNGNPVTQFDLNKEAYGGSIEALGLDPSKTEDSEKLAFLTSVFTERADYTFLRHFIEDGAVKMPFQLPNDASKD